MFIRYRGGGIGHKYMREVEAKYENMSLKRTHGNYCPKPDGTTTGGERPRAPNQPSGLGASDPIQLGGSQDGTGRDGGTLDGDEPGSNDEDYVPPETSNTNGEDSTEWEEYSDDGDRPVDSEPDDDDRPVDSEPDFDGVGLDVGYDSFGLADF